MADDTSAVPDGRSEADAMLALDDAAFVEQFGLTELVAPGKAAAAPAAPAQQQQSPAPTDGPERDAQGRFVKKSADWQSLDEPAPEQVPEAAPTADAQAPDQSQKAPAQEGEEAEGEEEQPDGPAQTTAGVITDPIAQFRCFDAEGELAPPALEIEFATKGREPERMRLDKVVRLAQQGRYNEALQNEVNEARTRLPAVEQQLTELREQIQAQLHLNRRLLTDPAFFDQSVAAYEAANTPEAENARLRQRLAEMEAQAAGAPRGGSPAEQGQQFVETRLQPTIDKLLKENPLVSFEEVWGRFTLLTAPLAVNGAVPPAKWDQVMTLLDAELGPWMAQLQEDRAANASQRARDSEATRRAQEEATKAKRMLARRVGSKRGTPTGTGALGTPSNRQPETAEEAVAQIMGAVAEQARAAR